MRITKVVLIIGTLSLGVILFGCSSSTIPTSSGHSYSQQVVWDIVEEWAEVTPGTVDSETSLYNLGSQKQPDSTLAAALSEEFPAREEIIIENYPSWTIVRDAEEDCLVQ